MLTSIVICRLIPSLHHNLTSHLTIGSIHQICRSDLYIRSVDQILAYIIHTKYTQIVFLNIVRRSSAFDLRTYLVCHPQVECVRPALIILRRSSVFDLRTFISPSTTRRSSVFDLRHLFFAGRVRWTCALFSLLLRLSFSIPYLFSLLYNKFHHVLS